ncbi:hypothetical protein [Conyzicola sp.]|uniref:hypothetical protein n=1 Tax=Conyzicola sp. TaxID=1969404 RepID=UPI0039892602
MIVEEQAFLTALAGVSATLIGAFLVGVFFYIDSEQHRHLTASAAADRYLRAGVQWIFIAFAVPLFVSLALVSMNTLVGAIVFIVFSLILIASTLDTGRSMVVRGGSGGSWILLVNHWFSTAAVIALVILPWIIDGWQPSPEAYVPSMLLALTAGFTSTAALVMAQFDATIGMSDEVDKVPDEPATS